MSNEEQGRVPDLLHSEFFRHVDREHPVQITPGPFEVSPAVLDAASRAVVGHRSNAFRKIVADNARMLLEAFEIPEHEDYVPVVLTGTGTAAMEAMVASTAPAGRPLVLVNGRFSQRLADIATIHNPSTEVLSFGVGEKIDVVRVEQRIQGTPDIDYLLFGVQDTRECILNPFDDLCRVAKKHNLRLCVDAISAMIAERLQASELKIDFFTASSGKAIRSLPGLGIVCGRREAFESLGAGVCRSYYLNLYEHYLVQAHQKEPRFAPAVSLHVCLNQALAELLDEGVAARRERIGCRTTRVREFLRARGATFLRPEDDMPHSITSVLLPEGFHFSQFHEALQEMGFLVYSGSSVVRDCFQIGTGGYLTDEVLEEGLTAIHRVLQNLKP